jgi:hypothetical protein
MSALGHKQTFAAQNGMFALPPKADMCSATRYVRFVPKADINMPSATCLCATYKQRRDDVVRIVNIFRLRSRRKQSNHVATTTEVYKRSFAVVLPY